MALHIGTKLVELLPMTRQEYNNYRGWQLPKDEQHLASEPGFLVEYVDGGRANDKRHKGYISWSPADVAKASYKASGKMTFGMATEAAKRGYKVARIGWNGAGMHSVIMPGYPDGVPANKATAQCHCIAEGTLLVINPYWVLKTANGSISTWAPSGSDSLAEDWCIVD